MKKLITILLCLVFVLSCCPFTAWADNNSSETVSDDQLCLFYLRVVAEMSSRKLLTDDQLGEALTFVNIEKLHDEGLLTDDEYTTLFLLTLALGKKSNTTTESDLPNDYTFGQGTFIVGQDLKAGTYDITCTSTSDEGLSNSMSEFGGIYSNYGMDDYADMFGSLGDMYGSIGGMTVKTYKANASYSDQYLTLKSGETARIILEDGGKIEISDGTAELTWIR